MKKTLILAAVALATCCTSVSAQTLVTNDNIGDQIKPGAVIALKCMNTTGGMNTWFNGAAAKSSTFSYENLFSLEATETDGTVTIKRLSDGKYLGVAGGNFTGQPLVTAVESVSDAVSFNISIPEVAGDNYSGWADNEYEGTGFERGVNTVRFTVSGSSYILNMNNASLTPKYHTGHGGFSAWFVYTYSDEDVAALEANTVVYYNEGTPLTSADQLVSGKYFISAVSGGEEAIVHSPNQSGLAAYWSTIKTVPSTGLTDEKYIWSIDVTPATDSTPATFTVTNVGTGKSLSIRGSGQGDKCTDANPSIGNIPYVSGNEAVASFKLVELAGEDSFSYEHSGKHFNWQLTNGTFSKEEHSTVSTTNYPFVHTNSAGTDRHFSYWENNNDLSASGSVCRIVLIPVKEERKAACEVTLTFPAMQNTIITIPNVQFGTDITTLIPTLDFFTSTGVAEENHIVSADNKTFTVQGSQALPIEFETVYRMKNKDEGSSKYLFFDGTNVFGNVTENETAMVGARLWYFKNAGFANGKQKVTLHTLALPEIWGATLANSNNGTSVTFTKSPTEFFIVTNSAAPTGFSLEHPNNPNCHLNKRGDLAAGLFATWTDAASKNDTGSGIFVYSLTDEDYNGMTATEQTFHGIAPYTPSEELVEAVKTERTVEAFLALFNPTADNLTTGEYFTIKYGRSGKYVHVYGYADANGNIQDADDCRRVRKADGPVTPDMIWTFAPSTIKEGAIQIVSPAANNYYIGQNGNRQNNVVITAQGQWGGNFNPVVVAADKWGFQIVNTQGEAIDSYLHDWGGNQGTEIGTWEGVTDDGNALWVERLTEYTYSIPEGAEYGGLCLPFAVQIPEGVSVYYANATKEGTNGYAQMHLMRLYDVIPARTAVLVKSESSTINFPIATVAAQAGLEDNILVGATLRRTGLESDSHYILHSAGNALVKNGETSELPTGAVALPVSKLSDPSHATDEIHMLIDAATDAIDEIGVEAAVAEGIYDLQGRRLAAPVKGINIINGKKVLVK